MLTGHVLDAITGRPIPAARISDDSGAATLTDDSGSYRLTLTKGVRYERAEAVGMYPAWVMAPSKWAPLVRDFRMFSRSSPTIEGRVIDTASQNPQPGTTVCVAGHFVLTDTIGHYILPLPSPGMYEIAAGMDEPLERNNNTYSSYVSSSVSVSVPSDSHPVVDLYLATRITIITINDAWPRPPLRNGWHRNWSEFLLEADYINRVGGFERAISEVPGVLIR